MHHFRMKNILAFVIAYAALGGQAAEVSMLCTGDLEETQVTTAQTKVTPVRLDVLVQADKGLVGIDGFWGCTLDMGSMGKPNRELVCGRALSVDVSDRQLSYRGTEDGPMYSGTTSYVLNRYTGTLTIANSVFAKPAAKANWTGVSFNAKLQCTAPPKLF